MVYYVDSAITEFIYGMVLDLCYEGNFDAGKHPKTVGNLLKILKDHNVNSITEFWELLPSMGSWPGVGKVTKNLLTEMLLHAAWMHQNDKLVVAPSPKFHIDGNAFNAMIDTPHTEPAEVIWTSNCEVEYHRDNNGVYSTKLEGKRPIYICVVFKQALECLSVSYKIINTVVDHIVETWGENVSVFVDTGEGPIEHWYEGYNVKRKDNEDIRFDYMYAIHNGQSVPRYVAIMEATAELSEIPYTIVTVA